MDFIFKVIVTLPAYILLGISGLWIVVLSGLFLCVFLVKLVIVGLPLGINICICILCLNWIRYMINGQAQATPQAQPQTIRRRTTITSNIRPLRQIQN